MTDLVKGTVARGRVPPPSEAHARGSAVEVFMVAVSIVLSPSMYQFSKKHFI